MTLAILTGMALCLLGAALWCLRQMREVLAEYRNQYNGGAGAALGYFVGAAISAIGVGVVLHRLLEVLQ